MFCPNCGTQLEDSALFCGSCGTRMNAQQPQEQQPQYEQPQYEQPQYEQPVYTQAPKKSKKPLFIAIGAVAVVAVVAVVLLLVLGGGAGSSSAKGAVELYIEVVTGKSDDLEAMAPKGVWTYLKEEEGVTVKDMKEEMKEAVQMIKSMKVSYKIGDSEKLDDDVVEAIAEELAAIYDLDEDSIKAAKTYEVEMTMKALGQSMTEDQDVTVVEIDGKWYCVDYYDYGDGDVSADFLIAS